ncbi:hypothetical protein PH30N_01886 [Cutibacterium modestum 30N]|nr:hypothetical protein HMPREF9621_01253 [Cutibacterium modestum HL037PA2]MCP2375057.1 hypothetical protein [Cutibacterium modestum 28N]MCP2379843.1 hypothetical protein [Cutibacterium modestum 30N]
MLTRERQAEVVKAAKRGQVRRGKGSVVHVEVFDDGCVGTSIIPRISACIRAWGSITDPHPHL